MLFIRFDCGVVAGLRISPALNNVFKWKNCGSNEKLAVFSAIPLAEV